MTSRIILLRTRSEPRLTLADGSELAIDIRRHPRARKWSLRYDLARDCLRLVMPKRGSQRAALAWAARQGEWVEKQRRKQDARTPLEPGSVVPFKGRDRLLVHETGKRGVRIEEDRIIVSGPQDAFAGRLLRWLKAEAKAVLDVESREVARRAGVEISRVGVGDARTRWGSCSSEGSLRYSWRLILMPDAVRRYVVAHEVAHRRHMDHGPQFHALEAELYDGSVDEAKRLLRLWGERVRLTG